MPIRARALCLVLFAAVAAPVQAQDRDANGLPVGATIEASGFATILTAPPVPYPDEPPLSDGGWMDPEAMLQWEMNANPSEAARKDAMALARRIEAREGRNFIGLRIVRDPDPRFAFQFQSDAASTLARYTDDARFVAIEGGVPAAELRPLANEWNTRFAPLRLGVGNVYEFDGVVRFDMQVDEATFQTIADAEGWSLPDLLELNFTPPPKPHAMDPALDSLVRIMPRHDRVPGAVLSAGMSGRVILQDGCLRLASEDPAYGDPLVIFDRDFALVVDDEGYIALQGPWVAGPMPRIGELMTWSGPRGVDDRDAGVQELRAVCGDGALVSVGTPSSAYHSRARPWVIDQLAHDQNISRQEAWDALRHCWALADEAGVHLRMSRSMSAQCGVPPVYL